MFFEKILASGVFLNTGLTQWSTDSKVKTTLNCTEYKKELLDAFHLCSDTKMGFDSYIEQLQPHCN